MYFWNADSSSSDKPFSGTCTETLCLEQMSFIAEKSADISRIILMYATDNSSRKLSPAQVPVLHLQEREFQRQMLDSSLFRLWLRQGAAHHNSISHHQAANNRQKSQRTSQQSLQAPGRAWRLYSPADESRKKRCKVATQKLWDLSSSRRLRRLLSLERRPL